MYMYVALTGHWPCVVTAIISVEPFQWSMCVAVVTTAVLVVYRPFIMVIKLVNQVLLTWCKQLLYTCTMY